MKVKSCAHSDKRRGAKPSHMLCHPALLLRCADPNPDDVRSRGVDPIHYLLILLRGKRAKGWRVGASHSKAGKAGPQPNRQFFGHRRRPAVEEVAVASLCGELAQSQHEIRAIDPLNV